MSMVIANNMSAVNTKRQFATSARGMSGAMEKLSSGYKINTGKDDPSGLVISEKLRSQLNGLKRAQQNTEEGINVMGIAEGALNEMNSILKKMKALAIHSNNTGVTSPEQVAADQAEMDSAIQTLDRIAQTTKFSDENLLNGSKDIAYETTTSIKGTQQNSLLNARETEFSQIFKRDGFAVSINFTGTTKADELTGAGEVDFSQQAMKAYLEVDTSKDDTNQAHVDGGKFTQDQAFTLTGVTGSRAFTFKQGETVANMVSQIKSAADSTGIDAALVFNSDQKIDMTTTGAASGTALGVSSFKIDGINSANGNAVAFQLNPTEDVTKAMEAAGLEAMNIKATIRGNEADGTQEIVLTDSTLGDLTVAWDGKASTLSAALKDAADNVPATPAASLARKDLLNALADGGLTASGDVSIEDSVVPTKYDITANSALPTTIVLENIFGPELPTGASNGSVEIEIAADDMDKMMEAISKNLENDPTKQKQFIDDLSSGKLQITAKALGSTSDFSVALTIGNGKTTYGTQNVPVDISGLAGATAADMTVVAPVVAGGLFNGAEITVNDADLAGYGYNADNAVVTGGSVVAKIPGAERETLYHAIPSIALDMALNAPSVTVTLDNVFAGSDGNFNAVAGDGTDALTFDINFANALNQDDIDELDNMVISLVQEPGNPESAPTFSLVVTDTASDSTITLLQGWDGNTNNVAIDFSKVQGLPSSTTDPLYKTLNRVFNGATISGPMIGGAMAATSQLTNADGDPISMNLDGTVEQLKAIQTAWDGAGGDTVQIGLKLASDVSGANILDESKYAYQVVIGDGTNEFTTTALFTAAQLAAGNVDLSTLAVTNGADANGLLAALKAVKLDTTGGPIANVVSLEDEITFAEATSGDVAGTLPTTVDIVDSDDGTAGKLTIATGGGYTAAGLFDDVYTSLAGDETKQKAFLTAVAGGTLKFQTSVAPTTPADFPGTDKTGTITLSLVDGSGTSFASETANVTDLTASNAAAAFSGVFADLTYATTAASGTTLTLNSGAGAIAGTAIAGTSAKVLMTDVTAAVNELAVDVDTEALNFVSLADAASYADSIFAADHLAPKAGGLTTGAMTVYEGAYNYDNAADGKEMGKVQVKFDGFDPANLITTNPDLATILGSDDASISATVSNDGTDNYLNLTIYDAASGDIGSTIQVKLGTDIALDANGETAGWLDLGDVNADWEGLNVQITNEVTPAGYDSGKLASGDTTPAALTGMSASGTSLGTAVTTVGFTSTGAAGQVGGVATDGSAARNAGTVAVFNNVTTMTDSKLKATDGSIEQGVKGVTMGADAAGSIQLGKNTDGQGRIYVKFLDDKSYELYKDASMSQESLVASGVSGQAINQANNSGLAGITLDLTGSELTKLNGVYLSVAGIEGSSTGANGADGVTYTGNLVNDPATALFDKDRTYMTGVELGKNTDSNGKIHMKAVYDKETGTMKVQAFKDANMRAEDLVAESDTFLVNGAESMTVVLNEKRNADDTAGTGLGIVLSMASGDILAGFDKDMTLKSEVEFKNLGARIFAQDYGSANYVKITQDKGRIFNYYGSAGQNTSKEMIDAGSDGITVQVAGQDATLSINGAQVKTTGLDLSMATQDIQANLVFNEGKVGSTTLAQVGYDAGSIFTKIGALNLSSVEAETEGKYVGLSGLMANAGHVTNEMVDNFQGGMQLQLGEGAGDQNRTVVAIKSMTSENLGRVTKIGNWETGSAVITEKTFTMKDVMGGGLASLSVNPTLAMSIIEQGISDVSELRAQIGAVQTNMLQTNSNNLAVTMENIQKTESGIRDADMADEMTEFTKQQVLQNAAMSMMSQANQASQNVLQLLR